MSEKRMKITDKRMFTPDGELRDEYRHLDEEGSGSEDATPNLEVERTAAVEPETPLPEPPSAGGDPDADADAIGQPPEAVEAPAPERAWESPGKHEFPRAPTLLDLIGVLAEPIPIYLGDANLPDGRSAENLEMARLYIDLLEVLRDKTKGNLEEQEKALLDDLLYRLRMRYVQKKG